VFLVLSKPGVTLYCLLKYVQSEGPTVILFRDFLSQSRRWSKSFCPRDESTLCMIYWESQGHLCPYINNNVRTSFIKIKWLAVHVCIQLVSWLWVNGQIVAVLRAVLLSLFVVDIIFIWCLLWCFFGVFVGSPSWSSSHSDPLPIMVSILPVNILDESLLNLVLVDDPSRVYVVEKIKTQSHEHLNNVTAQVSWFLLELALALPSAFALTVYGLSLFVYLVDCEYSITCLHLKTILIQ